MQVLSCKNASFIMQKTKKNKQNPTPNKTKPKNQLNKQQKKKAEKNPR